MGVLFSEQTRVLGGQPSTAAVLQKSTDEIIIKLCVKRMQLLFAPQQESIVSIMNLRATECHSYWLLISFGAEAVIRAHSLEIKGLFLMEISSKTLQNLPYFWNKKTQIDFFIFHFEQIWIFNSGCQQRPAIQCCPK